MNEAELDIARKLGKQVSQQCCDYGGSYIDGKDHHPNRDKVLPLYCPVCSENMFDVSIQPLSSVGDFEETLFCPHCEIYVDLIVRIPDRWTG